MSGLTPQAIKIFKACFAQISIKELHERIDYFRKFIDPRHLSEANLSKELRKLFGVEINGIPFTFFLKSDTMTYENQRFYFYRIRKLTAEDEEAIFAKKFPSMQSEQDIWTKPAALVKNYGRLNRPGESILYLGSTATNALYETNCQPGDFFFLQVYQNRDPMRISQIHGTQYLDEFDEIENAKLLMTHQFLLSEFTRTVPQHQELLYKNSLLIYENFFKAPEIDAFSYPSIKTLPKLGDNIIFDEASAKKNLKFLGVTVGRVMEKPSDAEFNTAIYYDGFLNESGGFDFFPCMSEEAKERFGDFMMIRNMGL